MINYSLLFAVLISMLLTRLKSFSGNVAALTVFAIFLAYSSDNGADYSFYKDGYEGITYSDAFPFVFGVKTVTVDQGFLCYMGIFRFFSESYNTFLCLNFILVTCLFGLVLKKNYSFGRIDLANLIYLAMPVIIPVAFYWSPRSAPSLLVMTVLCTALYSGRYLYAGILAFLASVFHSQYIPNVLGLMLFYCLARAHARGAFLVAFLSSLFVIMPLLNGDVVVSFMSLLDGRLKVIFFVAIEKLHYFTDGSVGGQIRYSFIPILFLEIILIYFLIARRRRGEVRDQVFLLLVFSIAFSLVVNISFFGSAHLAGRVSRYSDWIVATVGVMFLVENINSKKLGNLALNSVGFFSLAAYFSGVYYIVQ